MSSWGGNIPWSPPPPPDKTLCTRIYTYAYNVEQVYVDIHVHKWIAKRNNIL